MQYLLYWDGTISGPLTVQLYCFSWTGLPGPAALSGAVSLAAASNALPLASAVSLASSFIKKQEWPSRSTQPLNIFGWSAPAVSPPASRIQTSSAIGASCGGGGGAPFPLPAVRAVPATAAVRPPPHSAQPAPRPGRAARDPRPAPSLAPSLAPRPAPPARIPLPMPVPILITLKTPAPAPAPPEDKDDSWVVVEGPSCPLIPRLPGRRKPMEAAKLGKTPKLTLAPWGPPVEVRIREQPAVPPLYLRLADRPPRRTADAVGRADSAAGAGSGSSDSTGGYGSGAGAGAGAGCCAFRRRPLPDANDFEMMDISQVLLGMRHSKDSDPVVRELPSGLAVGSAMECGGFAEAGGLKEGSNKLVLPLAPPEYAGKLGCGRG